MMKITDDSIEQRSRLILAVIILLGALLRLYHVNYQSLWLDELYSIVPTDPKNSLKSVIEYSKSDQPPLFFIYLYYFFKVFGYSEPLGRVACSLIGIAGIPAIYFLAKECEDKKTALFAALLTAINYFHIYYSQELRFYSMAFLFATLSYLFFIRAFKANRLVDFVFYALFTSCLLYTHYYGLIILGTQAVTFVVLLFYKRDSKFVLLSILSAVVVFVSFLPWVPVIFNDLGDDLGWIKMPEPYFVAQYFYDYVGKDALTAAILIIFCYLFFKSVKSSEHKKNKPVFIIIVLWLVLSYLIPYIRSVVLSPMLSNRYTRVSLPGWIILFVIGWGKIKSYKWRYSLALILVASALINIFFLRHYYSRIKKDQFREASEIVLPKNKSHYPVLSSLPWHFNFYFRHEKEQINDLNSIDVSKMPLFWVLQAHFNEDEMASEIAKLSDRFDVMERHSFFGSSAILMKAK